MQSLRIVPSEFPPPSKSDVSTLSKFGVHDTFRHGLSSESHGSARHPLENRLARWEETQTNLKLTFERRIYGLHAPMRRMMEKKIVSNLHRFSGMPNSNLGLEILSGKDETLDMDDYLNTPEMSTQMVDFHTFMEAKMGIKL
ncbi:2646_t:CDS:2 [Paraglomus brasilianum]|uniref:2646_t:CDS:1 n=1 Tax=Paraglomus brasilianum TaxID=144538 RepID=A0A9N9D5S9_9GLOM|nr:2646_t:CDS:2 [Paraglomus brasilianum]